MLASVGTLKGSIDDDVCGHTGSSDNDVCGDLEDDVAET